MKNKQKFGKFKNDFLGTITESYNNKDKKKVSELLKFIKSNKKLKDLYLLYESIENKYISDPELAKSYVDELSNNLGRYSNVLDGVKLELNETTNSNELYNSLDVLLEDNNLNNIESKIIAKRNIIEHLITNKNVDETKVEYFTENQKLLSVVLVNDFNSKFNEQMSEEEKKIFKEITSLTESEINEKVNQLRNELTEKIIVLKEDNEDMVDKLDEVLNEINTMKPSKVNYYKMLDLKDGL